jgi:ADP-heptose:LPS heptosyltransferase
MARFITRLRGLRRKLAPPASRRERWARKLYLPLVQFTRGGLKSAVAVPPPVAELVWLGGTVMEVPAADTLPAPIRRLAVLKLDHIGDFILGMRAMRMLREGFPDAHITLVCASWAEDWARRSGLVDSIVPFDFFPALTREWDRSPERIKQLQDAVAASLPDSYDLAVDLRYGEDTTPVLYRIRTRYRAGFPAPIEPGLPHLDLIVPYSQAIGTGELKARSLQAELRLQMLAATVVAAFGAPQPHPIRACLTDTSPPLGSARQFALLSIGAGTAIRNWPVERYAEVGRALIERHDFDIVILGGRAEQQNAERLSALLPEGRVQLVIGRSLGELPQFVAGASLCVSNDTGMSHLSAALDVPTVVVLSGQDRMEVWRPAGVNAVAIGGWTPCQPCGLAEPGECRWGVPCLNVVTPAHVLEASERLLSRARDRAAEAESRRAVVVLERTVDASATSVRQSVHEAAEAERSAAIQQEVQQLARRLTQTVRRTDTALAEQGRRTDEARRAAAQAEERLAQVLNSSSWRVTAPLRASHRLASLGPWAALRRLASRGPRAVLRRLKGKELARRVFLTIARAFLQLPGSQRGVRLAYSMAPRPAEWLALRYQAYEQGAAERRAGATSRSAATAPIENPLDLSQPRLDDALSQFATVLSEEELRLCRQFIVGRLAHDTTD